ncbi:putative phage abortive infection protein [Bisgaard Taxon 10/6]|uniref:putative phage abortive infection protein n=1 Tax=Exercitatus varius TaxID=67857 RepID=UPI00294B572C|nr:putative phage abortive infection protein [Exercitatus varius]MDG2954703.1 putative phage abortive infection protein [Exercitatus varius]
MDQNNEDKKTNYILFGLPIIGSLMAGGVIWSFCKSDKSAENLGPIGDYIGGLINPIFGFLSFLALLYTIYLQIRSLKFQIKELQLTREELEATKEELARSAEAQEQSSKIFQQQQFESTFFALLNQIISSINDFNKANIVIKTIGSNNREIDRYNRVMKIIERSNESSIQIISSKLNDYDSAISSIFLLIYQLLKLIDTTEFVDSKKYSNMLRACLNSDMLHLFAINGCRDEFLQYRTYIEKYALLEHMPLSFNQSDDVPHSILINVAKCYESPAFGNSQYYNKVKEQFPEAFN